MISALQKLFVETVQSRSLLLRLFLFSVLGVFTVYFGFFHFSAVDSINLIKYTGYYIMLVALLAMGVETFLAARNHRGELFPWLKKSFGWPFVVLLVVLTLYLWFSQEMGYKIIMDEINLLGTSMYLHLDKISMSALRGYEINGTFLPMGGFVDKRPLFFPFMVSLVHDVTGYRPENAFYFNMSLIPVGLAITYVLGVMLSNIRGGLLAMLLLACFPMFNQCCHGGGFEALNLIMILITLLCACLYLRRPEPAFLSLLCLSVVLLANVRYESVLFIFPVALIIICGWMRAGHVVLSRGLYATPLLLLPVPMLHRVFEIDPKNAWQLSSKAADTPFSLEYFPRNMGEAIGLFFNFGYSQPVSVFLSFFGVIGCVLFLILLMRESRKKGPFRAEYLALTLMSLGILSLMVLLLLYFWDFDDIVTRRLALPIVIMFIFPGVAAVVALFKQRSVVLWMIGLSCLAMLIEVAPRNSRDEFTNEYSPGNVTNWKCDFIKEHADEYNLVIDVPGVWVTHKVPAITRDRALEKKELLRFHLTNKTFDNIYVAEMFTKDFADGVLRGGKNVRLDKDFVLESVSEKTFNGVVFVRMSKIVDIKVEEPAWIKDEFEKIDSSDFSRTELLEYQHEQQRRLASLLP